MSDEPIDHYVEALKAIDSRDHLVALTHAVLSLRQPYLLIEEQEEPEPPVATMNRGVESFGRP